MGKLKIPNTPPLLTRQYKELKGADFSAPPTECKPSRSPDMVNMISDNGGNPIKRVGWRYMDDLGEPIHDFKGSRNRFFISCRSKIRVVDIIQGERTKLGTKKDITVSNGGDSRIFLHDDNVLVFSKDLYIIDKDLNLKSLSEKAYSPVVTISKNPDGTGGSALDGVNLLTMNQTITFLGDGKSTEYFLDDKNSWADGKYKGTMIINAVKIEIQKTDGEFEVQDPNKYTLISTSNGFEPKITFKVAPSKPAITGQDNVKISYTISNKKQSDNAHKWMNAVLANKICKSYGGRIFVVAYDNRVYYTEVNKPEYFPDNNYFVIPDNGRIVGIHTQGSGIMIITENTMFLVEETKADKERAYAVKPTTSGTGAISERAFATLTDEPLFLARTGVYGISNLFTGSKNIIRNRSRFLDKKLCAEKDLHKAVATEWNRYYVLAINGHCYLLDGRQTTGDITQNTNYLFEGYYWENVPAQCIESFKGELWFSSENKLCKFNTDLSEDFAYSDGLIDKGDSYDESEKVAIHARWSTLIDTDGSPQKFKTLNKRGTVVNLIPYDHTSVSIWYSKDGETEIKIGDFNLSRFNWKPIDFLNFTFVSSNAPQDAYTNKKIKKYKTLQFIFENNVIDEPFGVLNFIKTFVMGSFSR